jgi:pilus assembly protein CpaB
MRRESALALSLAAVSGLFAAIGAYNWAPDQSGLPRTEIVAAPTIPLTTVVVAKEDLAFGTQLAKDKLLEMQWPTASVPKGSFSTIDAFFTEHQNRVVIEAIRGNEPVLSGKVTGPGQRASLSTMLGEGMKAVTIRVNDVIGVGGFVLPGDHVDIFMTHDGKAPADKPEAATPAFTDLLLQNLRVLAVDQIADPKKDAPVVARTVTVEASMQDAQRITLASSVGNLSLVLREEGSTASNLDWKRVTANDLSGDSGDKSRVATFQPTNTVAAPDAPVEGKPATAKINIVRSVDQKLEQKEYTVRRSASEE